MKTIEKIWNNWWQFVAISILIFSFILISKGSIAQVGEGNPQTPQNPINNENATIVLIISCIILIVGIVIAFIRVPHKNK
jgi:hypothetical protein